MAALAPTALGEHIRAGLGAAVEDVEVLLGQLIVRVRRDAVQPALAFLRDDPTCRFEQLVDITAVDFPDRPERFEVVYNLLSLKHNARVRLKLTAGEETPVPTAAGLYPCAVWYEREVWDMFGVFFADNPDLRRLLTDYGFEGHPLRKDFPLTGFVEMRYDDEQKRVVYDPVRLTQDFRTFDFLSPWEGMTPALPGDEKAAEPPKPPGT